MDVIDVPLIQAQSTTPQQALELLKQQGRASAVAQDGDSYRLFYFRHFLEAERAGVASVAQILGEGYPVCHLSSEEATEFALDPQAPVRIQSGLTRLLAAPRAQQMDYALFRGAGDTVAVVTRDAGLRRLLSLTGGFTCNGKPSHAFPDPEVEAGQPCPRYPECRRADGAVPTVWPA